MPTTSPPTDAGLAALRALRRALLRASVAAGSFAVVVVMVFGGGSERPARLAEREIVLDEIMTGTVAPRERYVATRSVLQAPGAPPCLRFADGTRRGTC